MGEKAELRSLVDWLGVENDRLNGELFDAENTITSLSDQLYSMRAQRDDLHRMVQAARDGFEKLHRALYPDVTSKRASAATEKAKKYTLGDISAWRERLWEERVNSWWVDERLA